MAAVVKPVTRAAGSNSGRKSMRRCVRFGVVALALVMGLAISTGAWAQTPWAAPDAEKGKKNPVAAGKKAVEQGKKVAKVNCASCHGAKGKEIGRASCRER